MTDVYTQTLTSGLTLVVTNQADFGEIIIAGLFLLLSGLAGIRLTFNLVYRK